MPNYPPPTGQDTSPYAINVVAGLIRAAATRIQIIVAAIHATRRLFRTSDIVVVEREPGGSNFRRLDTEALKGWLEGYSLSELWEKNVIVRASVMAVGCTAGGNLRRVST